MNTKEKIPYNTWAEIDLNNLRYNFRQLNRKAPAGMRMLAVIKAEAYGHGMVEVAKALLKEGVAFFGVADLSEGIALRKGGIRKPTLVFENVLPVYAEKFIDYDLTPTVCTVELARALSRRAQARKKKIGIHVKIDTGMGRLGVWQDEALDFVKKISAFKNLRIEGLYTHFPSADKDRRFTLKQIKEFSLLVRDIRNASVFARCAHAANSIGVVDYKTKEFNLARPGIMLYGLYPNNQLKRKVKLKPVMSVKSRIVFIKKIAKGRSVSYGRTFIAPQVMTIATLPIGYNDGYFRIFSNKASVLVDGKRCPVVGRVTMDQIMVDVTRAKNARVGSEVVLLGKSKNQEISADELAALAGTINYEIVCSLGNRLIRRYK